MRVVVGIIALCGFALTFSEGRADEAELVSADIRPFVSNSTDELGMLQNLLQANKLRADGNCSQASRLYGLIVRYDPDLEAAVTGLAECQLRLGQNAMALATLEKIQAGSQEIEILKVLAKAKTLTAEHRVVLLQDHVHQLEDARLWNLLGESLARLSEFEKAKMSYLKAEALGQPQGLLENNLGVLALSEGRISRASAYFAEAKEKAPSEMRYANNYRLSLLLNGQYVEALDGLKANSAYRFLYKAALVAENKGEHTLAKTLLQKAIKTSPTYFEAAERKLKRLG